MRHINEWENFWSQFDINIVGDLDLVCIKKYISFNKLIISIQKHN